jgi:hypothetical protein
MLRENDRAADAELTAEMVDAGALALAEYGWDEETLGEGAARIFQAMLLARATELPRDLY